MQIVVQYCTHCGGIKEFWLRNFMESGFYCKCGVNRIMRTYFGAEYLDYFTGRIGGHITVAGLVELAASEHMLIDPAKLQKTLQKMISTTTISAMADMD